MILKVNANSRTRPRHHDRCARSAGPRWSDISPTLHDHGALRHAGPTGQLSGDDADVLYSGGGPHRRHRGAKGRGKNLSGRGAGVRKRPRRQRLFVREWKPPRVQAKRECRSAEIAPRTCRPFILHSAFYILTFNWRHECESTAPHKPSWSACWSRRSTRSSGIPAAPS